MKVRSILMAVFAMATIMAGAASAETPAARIVLEALRPSAEAADDSGVSDRQLFEMCCWARGRSGFNHCVQYGVCVDEPGAVCRGRGAASGMQLDCGNESAGDHGDGSGSYDRSSFRAKIRGPSLGAVVF
jgi:hypothetical protein